MSAQKKRLLIIPARLGSKRIPKKNIKIFNGQPMINHVLRIASKTNIFNTIHVSTESKEIYEVCKKAGYEPKFMRPDYLADDQMGIMQVLKFVVDKFESNGIFFDTVCMMYATSPLTDHRDLISAAEIFEKSDGENALLSVCQYPTPVEKAWVISEEDQLVPHNPKAFKKRTQDLKPSFFDAGMFCFYTSKYVKESQEFGNPFSFKAFKVPYYRVTDIDDSQDWERAELMFKVLNEKS